MYAWVSTHISRPIVGILHLLTHWIFTPTLWEKQCYFPYFTGEKTASKSHWPRPQSYSWESNRQASPKARGLHQRALLPLTKQRDSVYTGQSSLKKPPPQGAKRKEAGNWEEPGSRLGQDLINLIRFEKFGTWGQSCKVFNNHGGEMRQTEETLQTHGIFCFR